jgi:hypothetical protein
MKNGSRYALLRALFDTLPCQLLGVGRYEVQRLILVAAWSNAWVCGRSLVAIAGSNPAGGMDVGLL